MSLESHGDPRRLLSASLEDRLFGWFSRAAGALLLAGVVAAWASLLTWSLTDPSLTHAADGSTRNLMGPVGAVFSDVMLTTLGFAAVFVLLAPMFWGIELMLAERILANRTKMALFPVSVFLVAGAFAAVPVTESWPFSSGFGGIVGDWLYQMATSLLALVGAEAARPVAGFVFFIVGFAALAHSVGLEREDLDRLVRRRGASRFTGMSSWLTRPFYRRESYTVEYGEGADAEGDGDWLDGQEPRLDGPASFDDEPAGAQEPGFDSQEPDFDVEPTMPACLYRAESPPTDMPVAPASWTPSPDETSEGRESTFDFNTDEASRAIAERFAPGAIAKSPAVEPPAPPRVRKSGLLGGFSLPRSASTFRPPVLGLLKRPSGAKGGPQYTQTVLRGTARLLEEVLADFGVQGEVSDIKPGPVVTLFELEPARGTKASRVVGLADDIARSMSVTSARAAVVPGRTVIGIELPNVKRETVYLREILEAPTFRNSDAVLPMALGKSIGGEPVVADLARMPHLLVAGTTGSGKSVGINAMVLSLLYRRSPEDCRLLMIDPKMLELSVYNGIPHLLTPVVTDPQEAIAALNWVVGEMEERYKRMAGLSVRNIEAFNARVKKAQSRGENLSRTVQTGFDNETGQAIYEKQDVQAEAMPYIVVVVDEFADLMSVAGKEIEAAVQRLAQMARAAGIHMIMATQRPSVDIVTGTIKANFPTRIGFKVASKIDSRTILNEPGAEQLLGQGDMLYSSGSGQTVRAHAPFVSDEEVEAVADALRHQGSPRYISGITDAKPILGAADNGQGGESVDDLYDKAVVVVLRDRRASTSYLQRRLSIGYNRAAGLIERMEEDGLIGPAKHGGKRDILITARDGNGAQSKAE